MTPILNPWPGLQALPPTEIYQVTVRIPRKVATHIERVFGGAGFVTGAIHTILAAIEHDLTRNKIHSYDPEYLFAVIQRLSAVAVATAEPGGDVTGTAKSLRAGTAQVSTGADAAEQGDVDESKGQQPTSKLAKRKHRREKT